MESQNLTERPFLSVIAELSSAWVVSECCYESLGHMYTHASGAIFLN